MDNDARWNFDTLECAMEAVQNAIYKTASELFEELERRDLIKGSGHHIAQMMALDAKMKVRVRWNYDLKKEGGDEVSIAYFL